MIDLFKTLGSTTSSAIAFDKDKIKALNSIIDKFGGINFIIVEYDVCNGAVKTEELKQILEQFGTEFQESQLLMVDITEDSYYSKTEAIDNPVKLFEEMVGIAIKQFAPKDYIIWSPYGNHEHTDLFKKNQGSRIILCDPISEDLIGQMLNKTFQN